MKIKERINIDSINVVKNFESKQLNIKFDMGAFKNVEILLPYKTINEDNIKDEIEQMMRGYIESNDIKNGKCEECRSLYSDMYQTYCKKDMNIYYNNKNQNCNLFELR